MEQANISTTIAPQLAASWIDAGNAAFERGALKEARQAFREAHGLQASHLSNYSLGLVAEAETHEDEAVAFYAAAVAADPFFVPARVNLGHMLRHAGRAEESFHHMLVGHALAPGHMLTTYGLAKAAAGLQRPDLAAALLPRLLAHAEAWPLAARIEEAIADRQSPAAPTAELSTVVEIISPDLLEAIALLDPANSATWTDFGNELLAAGRTEEAIAIQHQAVTIDPLGLAPTNNLSVALRMGGRAKEAVASALVALAIKPDWTCAWANLARAYGDAGALALAWDAWHLACSGADEAPVDWLSSLAEISRRLGRRDYALTILDRIASQRPGDYMVPNNRGAYLLDSGHAEAALACFEEAALLNPGSALPLSNCGAASELLGRYPDARDHYARALDLGGQDQGLRARLVHVSQHLCDWTGFDAHTSALAQELRQGDGPSIQPFSLLAVPGLGAADLRHAAELYARQYAGGSPAVSHPIISGRPPRIGYLSSDLYGHATAWLIAEILEQHDAEAFNIHVYSFGDAPEDPTRERVRRASPHFIDLNGLSDADAAARIRADGIDILVDLKGYTRGARPQILAFRPAPIQINYLGFPGTMGADFIDYIVADETIIPPSLEQLYSEKVLRLPHCYQPNDRRRPLPPAQSRQSLGLPERGVVLCSFNAAYKLTPDMFDIWCRLLREIADSCLWLLSSDDATNANLVREAQRRDVAADRLVFAPRTDLTSHLARFRAADLFLDSFPCTAHTTASDALWCGVPVVTRTGETFASRVAASVVAAAGLPELAVDTAEDYYRLALGLAGDRDQLAQLRAHLEDVRFSCPLFDSSAYTRDLETLYEEALVAAGRRQRQ